MKPEFTAHLLPPHRSIAHTPNDQGSPHYLDEHLRGVGELVIALVENLPKA